MQKTSGAMASHCNCCASCSFEQAEPMAANIEAYMKYPPTKNRQAEITSEIGTCTPARGELRVMPSEAKMPKEKRSAVEVIQIANWVKATAATPRIFPASSSKGRTEEIKTSMVRVVFSSITERMV